MQQTLAGEFADGRKIRAGAQLKLAPDRVQYVGRYLKGVHWFYLEIKTYINVDNWYIQDKGKNNNSCNKNLESNLHTYDSIK